jgi:hypothetical protein
MRFLKPVIALVFVAVASSACGFITLGGSPANHSAVAFKLALTNAKPAYAAPDLATAATSVIATTDPVNSEESADWSYTIDNCIGGVVACTAQSQITNWGTGFLGTGGGNTAYFDIPTLTTGAQEVEQDLEGCQYENDPNPCTDSWGAGTKDTADYDVGLPYTSAPSRGPLG